MSCIHVHISPRLATRLESAIVIGRQTLMGPEKDRTEQATVTDGEVAWS